jgi:putative ABC transport system permease protein
MDSVLNDIRYAFRRLRMMPGLTVAIVATLTIGIGGVAATFSVVDAAVLKPLPFLDPASLVRLREVTPEGNPFSISEPDYLDLARRMRSVSALAAIKPLQLTLSGAGDPTRLDAAAVSSTLFPVLGIQPASGRVFVAEDEANGRRAPIALISDSLWRRRFGGDPAAVGSRVRLDSQPVTIVGILPAEAVFPAADVWIPLAASPTNDRTDKWLDVIGRLSAGVTLAQARGDGAMVIGGLATEHPELRGWTMRVEPIEDWLVGPGLRRMMWVLLGAVLALLALACANIAGLLMTRTPARRFEMGVRGALGAGRGRLVRQLVTENVLLAVIGGAIGLLASAWMITALSTLLADLLPLGRVARIDGRVIAVTALVICAATVLFGILPALQAAPEDVEAALRASRRGTTRQNRRWSSALVTIQVALAMVLLAGSSLLVGSFMRLSRVDPGFETTGVLTVPLTLPEQRYPERARTTFFDTVIADLTSLQGVDSVAATATNPFRQWGYANGVTPEERAANASPSGLMQAGWRSVTPGFFETMKVPVMAGRPFTAADRDGGVPVAIVSRGLASRLWPAADAVGHRVYWGGVDGQPRTIVGVVGDVRDVSLDAPVTPMLYVPYAQVPLEGMTLVIRTSGPVAGLTDAIKADIRRLDPMLPVDEIRLLEANRQHAVSGPRFRTVLLAVFGTLALVLAAVGLYGVIAFTVAQQTREIAIRIALGARPGQVSAMFFRTGVLLVAAGTAVGLFVSWIAAGVLQALLFETSARDPWAFMLASAVLIAVTLSASYLPAHRAARLEPMAALARE